jgi:hypothetical protein
MKRKFKTLNKIIKEFPDVVLIDYCLKSEKGNWRIPHQVFLKIVEQKEVELDFQNCLYITPDGYDIKEDWLIPLPSKETIEEDLAIINKAREDVFKMLKDFQTISDHYVNRDSIIPYQSRALVVSRAVNAMSLGWHQHLFNTFNADTIIEIEVAKRLKERTP